MFTLVDSWGGEHVDDDHCLAGRMVGIERGVRRDALLRHGRPWLARQGRYHWISEARQLTLAILRTLERSSAGSRVRDCSSAIAAILDYSARLNRVRNRTDIN
jgi:hypothetical protein